MADPIPVQKAPYGIAAESGKTFSLFPYLYFWCTRGHNKGQPFRDGRVNELA